MKKMVKLSQKNATKKCALRAGILCSLFARPSVFNVNFDDDYTN